MKAGYFFFFFFVKKVMFSLVAVRVGKSTKHESISMTQKRLSRTARAGCRVKRHIQSQSPLPSSPAWIVTTAVKINKRVRWHGSGKQIRQMCTYTGGGRGPCDAFSTLAVKLVTQQLPPPTHTHNKTPPVLFIVVTKLYQMDEYSPFELFMKLLFQQLHRMNYYAH